MRHTEAINILKPEANTLEAVKTAFRKACKMYHPDINPNGEELMKLINAAYEHLTKHVGSWDHETDCTEDQGIDEIFSDILDKIAHLPGISVEVCGTWLWATGNTKEYKDIFKEHGMKWARKKVAWYWRPEGAKTWSRGKMSLDEIRIKYGSTTANRPATALN